MQGMASSPADLHWFKIVGLEPKLKTDDITAYFQTAAECGSGLVRMLIYMGLYKAKALVGMQGLDSNGLCALL